MAKVKLPPKSSVKGGVRERLTMDLQGKKYFQVAGRIVEFRQAHGFEYGISTHCIQIPLPEKRRDPETKKVEAVWVDTPHMVATISDSEGRVLAMGTKRIQDKAGPAGNFPAEVAETGAIGRALALLGFGTEEVFTEEDNGENLADAPQ